MTSPQRAALLDALTVERAAPRPKPWSNPRRDYQAEIDARRTALLDQDGDEDE